MELSDESLVTDSNSVSSLEVEVEKSQSDTEKARDAIVQSVLEEVKETLTDTEHPSLSLREMSMLERLSKNPNVVPKSQQRDEPDLSTEEKLKALVEIYNSFPVQFLSKFGRHLQPVDSACFDKLRESGPYEAAFHLEEIEKLWNKDSQEKLLKNRRYEALKKLVETTDYFSEEEMQRRNPILYDQLVGRYHTREEREAFLQQSWKSTSGSGTTSMPLTDLFLAHLERTPDGISCRRMAQESQQDEEDEADAEYDSENDEDYDMESSQPGPSSRQGKSPRLKPTVNDEPPMIEIEDEEKDLFKEEFFTTMYRNFLNGKDDDFDYSTVDDNPIYDCGENLDNDEEEKYFDDEEPCEVSEPNSDVDDLFKPPVRSSEIESKIEKLSVNTNSTHKEALVDCSITMNDDEEDELDVYMKEIEKQLIQ